MKEEWLLDGAAVPVTCETVTELVNEIKRLIDVIGGMALAQPEQEPVAWVQKDVLTLTHIIKVVVRREKDETYTEPLYTTPQPAQQEPTGMLSIDRLDKWLDASLKERKVQPDHIVDVNNMVAEQEFRVLTRLVPDWGAAQVHRWGLTMRDYFAAKAMKTYSDDTDELLLENAIRAYKQADAMIKARQA